jgi:hypothetical protein
VWEPGDFNDGTNDGCINGYRAASTAQLAAASDRVIFGNWNDLIIGMFGGFDVVVDPYSLSLNGQIRVVTQVLYDIGVRHVKSFCVSTDSGAQ